MIKGIIMSSRYIFLLYIIILVLISCTNNTTYKDSAPQCIKYGNLDSLAEQWGMIPHYKVMTNIVTTNGINIDTSGQEINITDVENLINNIDQCMLLLEPTIEGYCLSKVFVKPDKTCITIKVVNDWFIGCSGNQLLPWLAPEEACYNKKHYDCPCHWRSGMQDGHTVITTPNFLLFADWYIKVFYGCWQPWNDQNISKCASIQL